MNLLKWDNNRIQPYAMNPSYWQYNGEPKLLIGASDDDNLFQWTDKTLTDHLDLLASAGGNYVRNTMSDRDPGNVYAFRQIGENQYDLHEWNEEYWMRLVFFLKETKAREMIVQLTLWDQWDLVIPYYWQKHPWNSVCNMNYEGVSSSQHFFGTVKQGNELVLNFQRKYIDKLMSITLEYEHVLYNVNNESWAGVEWECYWAKYIHDLARSRSKTIELTSMQLHASGTARALHQFRDLYTYVDISQINQDAHGKIGQGHWDMLMSLRRIINANGTVPINNEKIYGAEKQEHRSIVITYNRYAGTKEEAIQRFWRDLFGGCASARFHRPTEDMYWGIGLSIEARAQLRAMGALLGKLNLFQCSPNNDLLSDRLDNEAYCMASIGRQYAVYFPKEGSVTIDPWVYHETWSLQWLQIESCEWTDKQPVSMGWETQEILWDLDNPNFKTSASIQLTAPGPGSWVALLNRVNE